MTKDQEIAALKAQVNAFIELQKEHYGDGMDTHLALIKLVKKTPQQCLAEHNEQLIRDLFDKKGAITIVETLVVDSDEAIEFLEEMKNEQ